MKIFILNAALFLSAVLPCSATETASAPDVQLVDMDNNSHHQLDFHDGYTNLTIYDYHVKILAEQRMSDNLVQIVVIPNEQGIRFKILNIKFEVAPPGVDLSGPVAKVEGVAMFRRNMQYPMRIREVVPVQIQSVSEFSISQDEAMMQGNECVQRQLPNSFSDSTG